MLSSHIHCRCPEHRFVHFQTVQTDYETNCLQSFPFPQTAKCLWLILIILIALHDKQTFVAFLTIKILRKIKCVIFLTSFDDPPCRAVFWLAPLVYFYTKLWSYNNLKWQSQYGSIIPKLYYLNWINFSLHWIGHLDFFLQNRSLGSYLETQTCSQKFYVGENDVKCFACVL